MKRVLRIQMFGGFTIYYGKEPIAFNKAENSKTLRLFQMLLLSTPGGITKSELLDNLYGWNEGTDAANRNKNLNNLIYRFRGQLSACGFPDVEYVVYKNGIYYLNCDVPMEIDTWQFEETIEQAKAAQAGDGHEEPYQLFLKANRIYCGELLPGNLSDIWFYRKSCYYKDLYMETVDVLEKEYIDKNDCMNRLELYRRVVAIYPFDNWQVKQIRCCLEMYRYEEALDIYKETMELYLREMGTPPAAEMQECFERINLHEDQRNKNGHGAYSWQEMDKTFKHRGKLVQDAVMEETDVHGAYYCAYPSFVDYCRMVIRAKGRNSFSAMLMFLTLTGKEKNGRQESIDLPEQMALLKEVIGESLRIGDAYTRYGNRHFILMLIKAEEEFCSTIFRRIEKAYMAKSGKGTLWYYADMTQELSL